MSMRLPDEILEPHPEEDETSQMSRKSSDQRDADYEEMKQDVNKDPDKSSSKAKEASSKESNNQQQNSGKTKKKSSDFLAKVSNEFLNRKSPETSGSPKQKRKHSQNLFPCPLVKTLDLDSPPEGSPASLGIMSGLSYYSVPFASSTSYTLACQQQQRRRRRAGPPKRVKSVQSPTTSMAVPMLPSAAHSSNSLRNLRFVPPQRQASLPIPEMTSSSSSTNFGLSHANNANAPSISPRSPQQRALRSAKSMHAQTHKLKRQVTICEDSVSIPDSQLFMSRQCSVAQSDISILAGPQANFSQPYQQYYHEFEIQPQCDHHLPRQSSRSPRTPSPRWGTASPKPSPQRMQPQTVLLRQESSFTMEEINSLQEAFSQFDKDGNGKLSRKEAEAALGQVLSESDLDYFLMEMKTDENGEVEWHDFLKAMKEKMREPESVKMLKEAFRVIAEEGPAPVDQTSDKGDNKSSSPRIPTIPANKIKHSLMLTASKSSEQDLDEMLRVLDLDGDGEIMMEDFLRLLVQEQRQRNCDQKESSKSKCMIL